MTPAAAICSWTIPSGPISVPMPSVSRCASAATIRCAGAHLCQVLNRALEGKPADLTVGLHVCRGNFRSTRISEGGYEPVAEVLFGGVNVDAFFLEYDNDRSGDFAPLRFIRPGHQQVVLGLITTKNGELENPQG